jgi:NAD(P)-dependent dehydrogenase (short-subunit alcohol dehydrogenase family)
LGVKPDPRSILITGAASGLGRALAIIYARPGINLHLGDRNAAGLAETVTQCREAGAAVHASTQDVTDHAGMAQWIGSCGRIDLVIGCAGVQFTSLVGDLETPEQVRATIAINFVGTVNTVLPAIEVMARQAAGPGGLRGQVAMLASLGAFVSVPGACTYTASKAGVDNWMLGRAAQARRDGIYLTSVTPGYIRTPLTSINECSMHGLMEPSEAARIIQRRLAKAPARLAFPLGMVLAARFGGLLPAGFPARMLERDYRRRAAKTQKMPLSCDGQAAGR